MKPKDVSQQRTPEIIWILGGGKFGRHAVAALERTCPEAQFILVEKETLPEPPGNVFCVHEDGVTWLARNLTADAKVSKIIPALPLHLAIEWLKKVLPEKGLSWQPVDIPDELLELLPGPIRQSPNQAIVSHANFICPDNCNEPDKICSHTGKPRPPSLFKILENLDHAPFTPLVIRSRQFAPGVGGFFPEDLWKLYNQAIAIQQTSVLIGTACKCHGIVDGLLISVNSRN